MSENGQSTQTVPAVVSFIKFLPLISEIGNVLNELIEIEQAAEHNKRTCKALLQRVYAADLAVLELKVQRNVEFFNNKNYLHLQNLVNVITQIKKFASEISQMKTDQDELNKVRSRIIIFMDYAI